MISGHKTMKANRTLFMAMAAIAALASVGCSKVELSSNETGRQAGDLVIKATVPQTKVSIASESGSYAMTWDTSDKAALISAGTLYESSAITISDDKKTAEFTFTGAAGISGDYDILAPYSTNTVKTSASGITATILQSQSSKASCPNGFVLKGSGSTPELNVAFDHLATYVKMNIKGLLPNETVHHVTVYLNGSILAGDITFDEEGNPVYDGHSNDKDNIYIGTWNIGKANASGEITVWFSAKPFTISAGKTFSVNICTETETTHELSLVAKKDIDFPVGAVVSLPVTVPAEKPMVTFVTNGGTAVDAQVLEPGDKVQPVKTTNYTDGLYEGDINPYDLFDGWYKDASFSEAFDFENDIPEGSITLYAKWKSAAPTPAKTTLKDAFTYVSEGTGTNYTYIMTADQNVNASSLNLKTNANAVIKIVGAISERKIKQTWGNCYVLNIAAGKVILGENVTLTGTLFQKSSAVELAGQFVMTDGSKIANTVHDASSENGNCRGVVHVNGDAAVFTMNGGEICGCSVTVASTQGYFAGTVSINKGKFVMNGGKIHGNSISAAHTVVLGGGVAMSPSRQFTKTGGEIYDNTAINTAETDSKFIGQQAAIGSKSNLWWVYKIDDSIGSDVTFDVSNIGESNPAGDPWIRIPRN